MAARSEEHANARKEEIIGACAALYETMSFRDITIKEISHYTSFSRPTIYNYFVTKEEIFLGLLQKEYELWTADLDALAAGSRRMTADELASAIAGTLTRRKRLLKLMSMNNYDMEANSRLERLVEFKAVYGETLRAVDRVIAAFRPGAPAEERQSFLYMFFPFVFGIYPYTEVTEKQRAAMEAAGTEFRYHSIYDISYPFIRRLLEALS